ncbi:MAG: CopD family protein [Alphaproteobacteria bacterium]|nr:CopD family protein [Alphaproteobacteria bacterium]
MNLLHPVFLALHSLAAIVWVGGMFFAHMALRPAVGPMSPKERLELWSRVFPRFFAWVWAAVVILLGTGHVIIVEVYGNMKSAGLFIEAMAAIGLVMAILFMYLFFVPYRRFNAAMRQSDLATAAVHQARIRQIVTVNMVLGMITVVVGTVGRLI